MASALSSGGQQGPAAGGASPSLDLSGHPLGPIGAGVLLSWLKAAGGAGGVAAGGGGAAPVSVAALGGLNLTGCGFGSEGAEQLLLAAGSGPATGMRRACLADNMLGQQASPPWLPINSLSFV